MKKRFSNSDLKNMIIPLLLEQLLVLLVGMADTVVVSYAGEAAVSGVSLVNQFNTIFIYIFTALATGGAAVISQYIGREDRDQASFAACQLLVFSTIVSAVLLVFTVIGNQHIMQFMFGKVEADVMDACVTYLRISAYSYPAIAIYNAGAAIYRSIGKTKTTMYISLLSNAINIVGNLIGVFVLHAGVAGVAWPSFISRVFSAVLITILCAQKYIDVGYQSKYIWTWNGPKMKSILHVALPNAFENGVFQLVKVGLSSIVALFGTYQIAANGVAQSIWSLAALASISMGPVFITVIGQCMGDSDIEGARYYFRKLLKISFLISLVWDLGLLVVLPLLLKLYSLSPETKSLIYQLVWIHNIGVIVCIPTVLGNGLRAAGDIRFTLYVNILGSVVVRLVLSYLFGVIFNLGVIGIALAMVCNWIFNAVCFAVRVKGNTWESCKLL